MALCTGPLLINERNRWREMSDRQLFRRLQQITKPEKLSCFLLVATDLNRSTLIRDGIDRCNALGYAPVERADGWWDVISADRYRGEDAPIPTDPLGLGGPAGRALRELSDGTEFMGDPPEEVNETIISNVHEVPYGAGIPESLEEKKTEPKKKKSIYSRKLRTKRRK